MTEKYNLSGKAKTFARVIVEEWNAGRVNEEFRVILMQGPGAAEFPSIYQEGVKDRSIVSPSEGILQELETHELIRVVRHNASRSITLLETLREAVASDFIRPEKPFQPMNVGTYIQGNLEITQGGLYQNIASGATVTVNTGTLAENLRQVISAEVLTANAELRAAIEALEDNDDESTRPGRIGRFFQALGGHLSVSADLATVALAIDAFARSIRL